MLLLSLGITPNIVMKWTGHSHRNIDKLIGKTLCVSNQLGYVFAREHQSFDRGKILDL